MTGKDYYGLNDNPDPPPERETPEERELREEAMLDAYDDRRWRQMEKSLDKALIALR